MSSIIDNKELDELMSILENMEDESLAVSFLKEFNDATKSLGELLINKDEALDHKDWKKECDKKQALVDSIVSKIREH